MQHSKWLTAMPLAAVALVGCYAMSPVPSPREYIAAREPSLVMVTRADGSVVPVEGPSVKGDSLMGFVNGRYQFVGRLTDVRTVTARRPAKGRTALLAGGAAVTLVGLAIALSSGGDSGEDFLCEDPPECTP
jgi:hypothetical protein